MVLDRLAASSPVVRVALPRIVRDRVTPLTVGQVRELAAITTHAMRHHYVSLLLDGGESVVAVAERIGDDPAMVLKVYGT